MYKVICTIVFIVGLTFIIIRHQRDKKDKRLDIKETNTKKLCKYCKSEIDKEAVVCAKCGRDQRFGNNPIWIIPIVILLVVGLYFILSPNAPLRVRKGVCGLGIRKGAPYCYYYVWEEDE